MNTIGNNSSLRALVLAAAALTTTSTVAFAADLGGNCCADLEERIAELEATTARKGNRKVKLTISGHVNESVLFWDDGDETNAYVVTNNNSRTRFRFVGDAKINADWSAGYLLEFGVRRSATDNVSQTQDDGGAVIDVRSSAWYLNSKTYGRVWLGQAASATDGITQINLSNTSVVADNKVTDNNASFRLRRSGVTGSAGLSSLTWGAGLGNTGDDAASPGEGIRNNIIKYVSPTFAGFTFQAAWGEDDMWDVALRYAGEFSGFRIAGGIGYQQWSDVDYGCATVVAGQKAVDCDALGLSGSIKHVPTGLYLSGAYGYVEDQNRSAAFGVNVEERDEFWYVQGGIEQKWLSIGATTLYGEYYSGDFGAGIGGNVPTVVAAGDALNSLSVAARIAGSELDVWGLGVVQAVDAAAMHLYFGYRNYQADVSLSANGSSVGAVKSRSIDDFQTFLAGGIIRF